MTLSGDEKPVVPVDVLDDEVCFLVDILVTPGYRVVCISTSLGCTMAGRDDVCRVLALALVAASECVKDACIAAVVDP